MWSDAAYAFLDEIQPRRKSLRERNITGHVELITATTSSSEFQQNVTLFEQTTSTSG